MATSKPLKIPDSIWALPGIPKAKEWRVGRLVSRYEGGNDVDWKTFDGEKARQYVDTFLECYFALKKLDLMPRRYVFNVRDDGSFIVVAGSITIDGREERPMFQEWDRQKVLDGVAGLAIYFFEWKERRTAPIPEGVVEQYSRLLAAVIATDK